MYRIGICDDEMETCFQIEHDLLNYGENKNIVIDTEVFSNGEELCGCLTDKERFDLIFLDIELGKMNGVEVGHVIREQMNDNETQVIFISSKENYALQLFQIRPFDFLVKPIRYENIERVMNTYIRLFDTEKYFFEYKVGKQTERMNVKEIIYFRSNAKKIEMTTVNGQYEFYGKMNNVEKQLDGTKFWRVHKSYIVNCDYILAYKSSEISLTHGNDVVPISQAYRESVKEKIMQIQLAKRGAVND